MRKRIVVGVGVVLVCIIALGFLLDHLGTRSGVSDAQVSEQLPGDDIFPDPWITIDRAAVLPASASTTWPWIAQLGADRAGWYAPLWLQDLLGKYAASSTLSQFQNVTIGEVIPDFGGGSLLVLSVVPGQYIEYASVPNTSSTSPIDYRFTWTLVLENYTSNSTTLHLRLRIPKPKKYSFIPPSLPGLFDFAADEVMFLGLAQQLKK
jgi:hypothetical protein